MFNWFRRRKEEYALPAIPTKADYAGSVLLFEGITTDAGAVINEDTALKIDTVFTCLKVIAERVAMTPRHIYQRVANGREIYRDHPVYNLIHSAPNDYMTSFELLETLVHHLCLYGNAYCYIDRDGSAVPTSIQPLLPDRTEPELRNGSLIYWSKVGGTKVEFSPADIIHIKAMGFDGVSGYPVVRMIRQLLGTAKAQTEYQSKFYGSGAHLGGVLTIKGVLDPAAKKKVMSDLMEEHRGNSNAFKILGLPEGWTFAPHGVAPVDAQMVEAQTLAIRRIAAAYKVPAHMVGLEGNTSYSSLEQVERSFLTDCINPYLRRIEDAFNSKLLAESEKHDTYFEFNRMGFLQADLNAQTQHFNTMLQARVLLPNEVREFYGLNPLPGGNEPLNTPNNTSPNPASPEGNAAPKAEETTE